MSGVNLAEVNRLAADLGRIGAAALKEVEAVVEKGALNIKTGMNADAAASRHFHAMSGAVTYDSHYGVGTVRYVIGPDKGHRGGALGNIAYFGTSRGGGTLDIEKPLREEEPKFRANLLNAVDNLVGRL